MLQLLLARILPRLWQHACTGLRQESKDHLEAIRELLVAMPGRDQELFDTTADVRDIADVLRINI